ncbi:AAA family ATPase [Alloalcanivorax gelatiniphagus]|uniref:GTP-binding protein n=1 Tax=Alloalcanivorax gelatiniphagus TaxID=1194167 RepID=A0ABY2XMX4_9GAMM|nr:AAA family ATPase [Alloalcanivorax gelatiniphagus]TMW13725.1 GTP-binding protein [Alloalcanivorax gelatiniphagus]|tara:strand:- start:5868 stop:8504 length:2637 start_codon:yes stop_codon:yes gene_type:complete
MRLLRLKAEQLRQFREPVEIEDLDAGINLFTGPNESGKSTLVRAIRAAFFERHKSSSVDDLQPWGDSASAPTVELDFEWQGQSWRLVKSFLKKKRCDLTVDGTVYSGDEGEEKLSSLLGYEYAAKGASQQRHWGIPGLLWVEQGTGQEIQAPVGYAGQHLKAALGGNLGEMTSSTGDELINQVAKERSSLLTGTGRPTGSYAQALADEQGLQGQLSDIQGRVREYREHVDRLGQLRDEQARAEADRLWETYRQQAKEAEGRLAEVMAWQKDQDRDQQALEECQTSIQTTLDLLNGFQGQQAELARRQDEKVKEELAQADLEARKPAREKALAEAVQAHEAARKTLKLAQQHQQRREWAREREGIEADLESDTAKLARARELHSVLLENRQKRQSLDIDPQVVERLKDVTSELDRLAIQQDAVSTRLQFDLTDDQSVTLDGKKVVGRSEHLLIEPGEVAIKGVGTLRVLPGGEDVAEIARARQNLTDEQESLLSRLRVTSLAEAEGRLSQLRELQQAIQRDESLLNESAPEGLEALSDRLRLRQARKDELASQMQALPEQDDNSLSLSRAETRLESAQQALEAAEAAKQKLTGDFSLAEQSLNRAKKEWERLNNELQAPDRKQRQKQAENRLIDLRVKQRSLNEKLLERNKQIEQAKPAVLEQDVERLNRSADAAEQQEKKRSRELIQIQARLEAAGAEGLEEQSAELGSELEHAIRRRRELERRAKALDLLNTRLREHRLELTRQLQEPLQRHLNHYLQLLFPEASLEVDENLIPEVLIRQGHGVEERGKFEELSFGAREQMALISRLAYADLLLEAGRPTLIILDDALVHSDAARLGAMKRVLYDAAQRHQILLFTCHPDNWRDLGVTARDVEVLQG